MRLALICALALSACATAPAPPMVFDGQASARIGETARIGDVAIRPLEVLEDSRCPVNVECIHAGFFRVRVEIHTANEHRTQTMDLRQGLALADSRSLRLSDVTPPRRMDGPQTPLNYRLTFTLGPGD